MVTIFWAENLNSDPRVVGLESDWTFSGIRCERLLRLAYINNNGGGSIRIRSDNKYILLTAIISDSARRYFVS